MDALPQEEWGAIACPNPCSNPTYWQKDLGQPCQTDNTVAQACIVLQENYYYNGWADVQGLTPLTLKAQLEMWFRSNHGVVASIDKFWVPASAIIQTADLYTTVIGVTIGQRMTTFHFNYICPVYFMLNLLPAKLSVARDMQAVFNAVFALYGLNTQWPDVPTAPRVFDDWVKITLKLVRSGWTGNATAKSNSVLIGQLQTLCKGVLLPEETLAQIGQLNKFISTQYPTWTKCL